MASTYYQEGNYVARIISQSLTESAAKKTPQFVLGIEILGPCDPDNAQNFIPNRYDVLKRSVYLYFTEGAIERTVKVLHLLGFNRQSFIYLSPTTSGYENFTNQEIEVFCEHETTQRGGKVEKWGVSLGERAALPELEASKARQLDMLYGKQLRAGKPNPSAKAAIAVQQEITSDDVPF